MIDHDGDLRLHNCRLVLRGNRWIGTNPGTADSTTALQPPSPQESHFCCRTDLHEHGLSVAVCRPASLENMQHCDRPFGWQSPGWTLEAFVLAFGFSGAKGWIIFGVLCIVDYVFHLVTRRFGIKPRQG
jgi:hypothetical protein